MSEAGPAAGQAAPDFTMPASGGRSVSLAALRGRPFLLYFYPKADTPGCTKQACDFSDSLDSLKAKGYEVLGISPDAPAKLAKFRAKDHLTITLLSDPDKQALNAYGAWGEKLVNGEITEGLVRSTVVLDTEGNVVLAQYQVKADGHVAALKEALGF